MPMRSAGDGSLIPPRRDPELFYRMVAEGCWASMIFRSNYSLHCDQHGKTTLVDYLFHVLKPHRDNGTMPLFDNVAEAVAFTLAQPTAPASPATIRVRLKTGTDVNVRPSDIASYTQISVNRFNVTLTDNRTGTVSDSALKEKLG